MASTLGLEGIEAIVFGTVNEQPTSWDSILPPELLVPRGQVHHHRARPRGRIGQRGRLRGRQEHVGIIDYARRATGRTAFARHLT